MKTDSETDKARSGSVQPAGSEKCPDCRGYGNNAYGDGLEWWNVKCEVCNGTGRTEAKP